MIKSLPGKPRRPRMSWVQIRNFLLTGRIIPPEDALQDEETDEFLLDEQTNDFLQDE